MLDLIEKENIKTNNKMAKPDFCTRTGRELWSYYLQTKFKQLIQCDAKDATPIIINIRNNFISEFTKRLVSNYQKKILIGITGESASGKTTICKKLQELIDLYDMPIEILSADNYFNDISSLVKEYGGFDNLLESGFDVDSPNNFQLDLMREDLTKLSNGENILAPQYLVNGTGISVPKTIPVFAKKIIVVEGISTFYDGIDHLFDVKIYVDADEKKRKQLFLGRAKERNQTAADCLKHWNYVCRVSEKYVKPAKVKADIVINGYSSLEHYSQLFSYLYKITNNFCT